MGSPTLTAKSSPRCAPNADRPSGARSWRAGMDAERLARLEHLADRQDILDCLNRFSRGMDRFDQDLFLSAFHPDATIAAGIFVGGPKPLYEWARALHDQGQVVTHHNMLNHSCEIEGSTAHTETYYLFVGRNRDDS